MRISKKWLQQYLDVSDLSAQEIADRITDAGLEVEGLEAMSSGTNLMIGEVETCVDHPDSDHLHICQVNFGDKTEQIICGAPNVRAGIKVIAALPGAKLPGGEIQAGNIRGLESNGMICSLAELGVDPKQLRDDQKNGIEILPADAPIGDRDPLAYLGLDDVVLDVSLTPNRNNCMAGWAMAVETGAVLNRSVKLPNCEGAANEGSATRLKVSSTTKKCPLFLGKVINHVTIKESPKWMKELLAASGIKSINNVVDISNIVMLETGQPLHFYDVKAIPAQEITVKDQLECTYTALDGIEYTIEKDDLIITSEGKPIGIAGIMGGDDSKIEADTAGIIIEAASFHHVNIRNTSRRLNLSTDASIRYQKGIEPLAAYKAMDRAVALLKEYADADGLEATVQYGDDAYTPVEITVSPSRINRLLGTDIAVSEMVDVCRRLQLQPSMQGEDIHVVIPSVRQDLLIEADIAEEIIRIIGYDRLPSTMPLMAATVGALNERQQMRRRIRSLFTGFGLYDMITYTLASQKQVDDAIMGLTPVVELASPMSEDRKYVRGSILPSLLDSVAYNQNRSVKELACFEMSSVYAKGIEEEHLAIVLCDTLQKSQWQNIVIPADFYTLKGIIKTMLAQFGFEGTRVIVKPNTVDVGHFHPNKSACIYIGKDLLGIFGDIHPMMAKRYNVSSAVMAELNMEVLLKNRASKVKFAPISKYPSVTRDLALVVKTETASEDIIDTIRKSGKRMVTDVEVFDVYTGEHVAPGSKSIALRVTFQSDDKTLTDKEINEVYEKLLNALKQELQAELR